MALTGDILASYRGPGPVLRRRLGSNVDGRGEARALVTLMLACALIFVAQWPRLSRESHLTGQELNMLLGGALLGWLFIAPPVLYGLAGLSHVMWGMVAGFIGPGPALDITGVAALIAFLALWLSGLYAFEFGRTA